MSVQIFHGDVLYSKDKDTLVSYKGGYIVVKDGLVDEIFEELPEQYKNLPINDYGKRRYYSIFFRLTCTRQPIHRKRPWHGLPFAGLA